MIATLAGSLNFITTGEYDDRMLYGSKQPMKYARIERERRFLLTRLPKDLPKTYVKIDDRYIGDTRFRLRRVTDMSNVVVALKLTQKYREPGAHASHCTITNMYLNQEEYESFQILGGMVLRKHRYLYESNNLRFAIDVFRGVLNGLVLAEVEFDDDATMRQMTLPEFADIEVTDDPFFAGGKLCRVSGVDLSSRLKRCASRMTNG